MALDPPKQTSFTLKLPFEVQAMILRYVVNDILEGLRSDTKPYADRLQRYLHLRLISKSTDEILSQLPFDGQPLDRLLRNKQLEKLDHVLETIGAFGLSHYANAPSMSVSKVKGLCGRFWHNPDLSANTIKSMFFLCNPRHRLNFAIKLERWIDNHRERSKSSSHSQDGIFFFEQGDWIVDAGELQIRRLSRWRPNGRKRIAMYLGYESGLPVTDVHLRLGNERKWYMECEFPNGECLKCLVNYERGLVWDHYCERLLTFDGRLIGLGPDDEEDSDSADADMAERI